MRKKQALATQTRKKKGRIFELDIESKTEDEDGMLKVNWSTSLLARAAKGDKRRNEQRNEKHRSEHTGEAEKDNLTSEGNRELTKKKQKKRKEGATKRKQSVRAQSATTNARAYSQNLRSFNQSMWELRHCPRKKQRIRIRWLVSNSGNKETLSRQSGT